MPTANQITGLRSQSSGGTTLTIEPGYARDSADSAWIEIPTGQSRNVNVTTSGLGGLDTGSVAAKTVYALYVVASGTSIYGIVSLSFTAPSGLPGGAKYRRIGTVFTNSSSQLVAYAQNGGSNDRSQAYTSDAADLVVVNNGNSTSYANFNSSPPNSPKGWTAVLYVVPSAGGTTTLKAGTVETAVTAPTTLSFTFPTGSTWGSYKVSGGSTTTISVHGFEETV